VSKKTNTADAAPEIAEAPAAEPAAKQGRQEYMARYYAENREEIAARKKAARMARRDEINAASRETYASDPAVRKRRLEIKAKGRKAYRERLAADPETQRQHEERLARRRRRHRERLAADPAYRKQREAHVRTMREKRKKKGKEGDGPQKAAAPPPSLSFP
jgi:hypothetical protein